MAESFESFQARCAWEVIWKASDGSSTSQLFETRAEAEVAANVLRGERPASPADGAEHQWLMWTAPAPGTTILSVEMRPLR
jgi:hypothetical protein